MFGLTPYETSNHAFDFFPFTAMDEMEKHFFGNRLGSFKTDIQENESGYVLKADLPGFDKTELKLSVNNGYLTIRAEKNSETSEEAPKEDGAKGYIRRERFCGNMERSFDISNIQADAISASFENGVLTLQLPKKQEVLPQTREIAIG